MHSSWNKRLSSVMSHNCYALLNERPQYISGFLSIAGPVPHWTTPALAMAGGKPDSIPSPAHHKFTLKGFFLAPPHFPSVLKEKSVSYSI